jgi:hypothetical protein
VTARKTPGQAAYEAGPLGWVGRGIWPPVPWEKLTPEDHAWWDKIARANDPWPDWALLADARQEAEKLRAENARLCEALAAQEPPAAPGIPLRSDAETCAMLRADLADCEALLARWPKCPAGCTCRIGIPEDADVGECGCDGPCNGGEPG